MEQIKFPFITEPETPKDPPKEEVPLDLEALTREELEALYVEKVGRKRYFGRTDEEVREAIQDPEKELDRLREADRTDAWEDIGPTGK
ncbi:MAG: hypothetical protein KIH67_001430 [Candidatus Moranbacteria bacterium]|nr:hypothetical protein [Candidatus Moranbacteria bacterium]